jgi:glycosyltransferase involved in cell wall biosynthesis
MRILLLTSSYPTPTEPIASAFLRDSVSALSDRGHTITVIAPADRRGSPGSDSRSNERTVFVNYMPRPWLQTLAYGAGMYDNARANPAILTQLPPMLVAMHREARRAAATADVIHAHWLFPSGLIGALLTRELGVPLVITIHSTDYHLLRSLPGGRSLARRIVRHASRLHFVTNYHRQQFIDWLGDGCNGLEARSYVLPMGVADDLACRPPAPLAARPRLGFLGRLVPVKGVDRLLRACAAVGEVNLTIAGAGPAYGDLARLATELVPATRFVGTVSGAGKSRFLDSCDVFVFPSRVYGSGRGEGLPVSLLEALARGRVVITSDSGGIPEVVRHGHNGYVFSSRQQTSLVDLLRFVIGSWPMARHVADRARETGRRHTTSAAASVHELNYLQAAGIKSADDELAC